TVQSINDLRLLGSNLLLVFPGQSVCTFLYKPRAPPDIILRPRLSDNRRNSWALANSDSTPAIVSTALPTIVRDLGGASGYSWVGTAYLLTSAACAPLYGVLTDMFGRKPALFGVILCFLLGSALCGAAKSFVWLCIARGVKGIGGGGAIQHVSRIEANTLALSELLGDLFLVNLPTGGFAIALLALFLNPYKIYVQEFDFLGLLLVVGGTVCILLGFNFSQTSWRDAKTISLIVVGGVLFIACAFNEFALKKRNPILPPRLFKTRTTAGILLSSFIQFMALSGASATRSGIYTVPFSVIGSFFAIVGGQIVARTGKYRPTLWASWGLLYLLNENSSKAMQVALPIIAA
ncbi:6125_t:CDS:10, partial [Acaulospora colombiana]